MTETPLTLEEMERRINAMSPGQRAELAKIAKPFLDKPWLPQIGPQSDAYHSLADETLYGGAAGGGKSDLLLGLATTAHTKSVIFRRQSTDLETMWERLQVIMAGRLTKKDANKKRARTNDGRFIEFAHLEKPGSEKAHQGRDRDLYGFDEAAQMDEWKVAFVIQWLRSTKHGQRKRVVFGTNPPIPEFDPKTGQLLDTGTGQWLMEWFAPWLDDGFAWPAQPGELRWCFMRTEGNRMSTIWVEGPGGYDPATGQRIEHYTDADIAAGRVAVAKSRTFIKSLLKDNAFLTGTGYAERLSTTPEPMKSLLLTGSFTVKGEDHPMQVIPTAYVLEAQARWKKRVAEGSHKNLRQLVLFGDVAQGGADTSVLASLLETDFFEDNFAQPGRLTPTGKEVVSMVLNRRRDASLVGLDGTGGWGGSTRDLLDVLHKITAEMLISSEGSTEWTPDMRYKFGNMRSQFWWAFRLALDPKSGFEICLPPSTRILTQLTAPLFYYRGNTIFIESKDELRTRIGTSTDDADAILGAWHYRDMAIARLQTYTVDIVDRIVHGVTPAQRMAEAALPIEQDDPLGAWR
jgi:hypothetical protein